MRSTSPSRAASCKGPARTVAVVQAKATRTRIKCFMKNTPPPSPGGIHKSTAEEFGERMAIRQFLAQKWLYRVGLFVDTATAWNFGRTADASMTCDLPVVVKAMRLDRGVVNRSQGELLKAGLHPPLRHRVIRKL